MALYSAYTDEQLIHLLQSSDGAAFTELYNRYWEQLFAISYNYSKQKETAEEVVQEVFMSLWDRRNTVDINDLAAYLATASKFSILKHLLKNKRRKQLLEQHFTGPLISNTEEEAINARFLKDYINGVVEKLPEQCQVVFRYSREKNLSIPEIAAKLNISPKTVESHLSKALKTLRYSLKNVRLWLLTAVCYLFY